MRLPKPTPLPTPSPILPRNTSFRNPESQSSKTLQQDPSYFIKSNSPITMMIKCQMYCPISPAHSHRNSVMSIISCLLIILECQRFPFTYSLGAIRGENRTPREADEASARRGRIVWGITCGVLKTVDAGNSVLLEGVRVDSVLSIEIAPKYGNRWRRKHRGRRRTVKSLLTPIEI